MAGLCNPLRTYVELQRPAGLEEAREVARAYEQRLEIDTTTTPVTAVLVTSKADGPQSHGARHVLRPPHT